MLCLYIVRCNVSAYNGRWVIGLSGMPKKVSRMLPVQSASHVIDENCKERMAAKQHLAGSSAIIRAVLNLVGKKRLLPTKEVLSMKEQEELRVTINGLLESMKELESASSAGKRGSSAPQLPNVEGDDIFEPAAVFKRTIFSGYKNTPFELLQLQRSYFLTSMSRLARRNTSVNHKVMREKDRELPKQDFDTVGQTFEQLQNTTWKSSNNLPEQQHSHGDKILKSVIDSLSNSIFVVFFCLDENSRLQTACETCE